MLKTLAYFMPCLVSLLWFSIFIMKKKNLRQKVFTGILGLNVVYYAAYAFYIMPEITDYHTMVVMDSISMPVMLLNLVVLIAYLQIHTTDRRPGNKINMLVLPAIISGTIIDILYYIIGYDKTAEMAMMYDNNIPYPEEFHTDLFRVYAYMVDKGTSIVAMAYMAIVFAMSLRLMKKDGYAFGDISRFFFRKGTSTTSRSIAFLLIMLVIFMLPLAIMGRKNLVENPEIGLSLTMAVTIVIFFTSYIEYFCHDKQSFTLKELSNMEPQG